LAAAGYTVLGNGWQDVTIRGVRCVVVGHEGPWFPAPDCAQTPSPAAEPRPLPGGERCSPEVPMSHSGGPAAPTSPRRGEIAERPEGSEAGEGVSSLPRPVAAPPGLFRLCLSHTPDNFYWAITNRIDLMFCGHVHGGGIRVPLVGSIFVPSVYGRRFDHGVFETAG